MSQAPAAARPRASGPRYRRRRPEDTALYRIIQQHLETFVARLEASATAVHWPVFVLREFSAFLTCGILAHGFARVHCPGCGKDALVALHCYSYCVPSVAAASLGGFSAAVRWGSSYRQRPLSSTR
jgi:hypothetical protein